MDEFDLALEIFNQSRATFNPIPAIQVVHTSDHFRLGPMDVAADDAISVLATRHGGKRIFIIRDKFDGGFGLGFQVSGQRPVTKTAGPAQAVEIQIQVEDPVVKMRTQLFQQMIEVREAIRLMTVDDKVFFPIGRGMDHLMRHDHAAEPHPGKLVNELIMVAGDIDDLGLLAAFAQQFLDEHVVVVAPEPAEFQFPAVDQIPDNVEVFAVHDAQEFQQLLHAGVLGAEMDVGDPDGTADDGFV